MKWPEEIERLIEKLKGKPAVAIKNLTSGESYFYNAEEIYPAASVIKLPLLVGLFKKAEEGLLSLRQRHPLVQAEKDLVGTIGSGILQDLENGLEPTVADLAMLAISVSDNIATNMLIDLVGMDYVNQTMGSLGFQATRMITKIGNYAAMAQGHDNKINAREMVTLLERLYHGEVINPSVSEGILRILKRQKFSHIAALLPLGTEVASKSGSLKGIRHDVGLVYLPQGAFAMAVLTRELEKPRDGATFISKVAWKSYQRFQGRRRKTVA
ncbi:MAG: class A beta-lactamase-related serine hydrolase [Firmicutes bacterium]|nr:class A beta-lactamase-related serine hydrolase [Bacillota bacterium]MCL5039391.1 class A beta-lactamase-related serine hydrolase [Bacillota bacterium]